jgi:soluble P-type ATPase
MIELTIPGFNDHLSLTDLILDFNGTLAIDGKMIDGVKERLVALSKVLTIHVVTGNSNGTAEEELKGIPCKIALLSPENQAKGKYQYLSHLNPASVISIGNGRNDCLLLESSAIGVIVIQEEGASVDTLSHADIVCNSIITALDLIVNVRRLTATLRS